MCQKVQWASPLQRAAFEYGPDPLCMSGGYGSGKTFLGALKALFVSDVFPRNRGVIARRKWVDLQKTTMSTFFKLCPPEDYMYGRRSDQEKILRMNNGSEIIWLHLDDPEQENVIQGIEINWFLIDQAEEVEEEIFDKLSARLGRWDQALVPDWLLAWWDEVYAEPWPWKTLAGKPLVPNFPMFTCNPDTKLHWMLNAHITAELLLQVFYPNTPLHDGGVIIIGSNLVAAASVLPLSSSGVLNRGPERQMGLRHRAALGISELSDAVAVVVSEETGNISIVHSGKMTRRLDAERLDNILRSFFKPAPPRGILQSWWAPLNNNSGNERKGETPK